MGYINVINQQSFEPLQQRDLDFLWPIAKNEEESSLSRCRAFYHIGYAHLEKGECQAAADNFRDAIHIIDTAKASEKEAYVRRPDNGVYTDTKVETELQRRRQQIKERLDKTKHWSAPISNWLPDSESIPICYPEDRPSLLDRLMVGGDKCDCCGKTLEELRVHKLDTCSRCKMVYYCSVACGMKAWKGGHKKYCRKKNEIVKGDTMMLVNLVSKPKWNGQLVDILGHDRRRWKTQLVATDEIVSIAPEKLRHIRPVA
jgi:MYND finger